MLYEAVFGEPEELVPRHPELVNVLWEMGLLPDVRVLPEFVRPRISATREDAVQSALDQLPSDQWALWALGEALTSRIRMLVDERFNKLFEETAGGYLPRWIEPRREVLITWTTGD